MITRLVRVINSRLSKAGWICGVSRMRMDILKGEFVMGKLVRMGEDKKQRLVF